MLSSELFFRPKILIFVLLFQRADSSKNRSVEYFWNVPSFQCDSTKYNFTSLAQKYKIVQNENDRFIGEKITILYDPGKFPAILHSDNNKLLFRNGGIPQQGNLSLHLQTFAKKIEQLIDKNFTGLGVIDFESWRPILRQNFGTLKIYKKYSYNLVKSKNPFWAPSKLQKEAKKQFEQAAKKFMRETLKLAKNLRSKAKWGYYAYPYCFNMSPKNMQKHCSRQVQIENSKLHWLFKMVDNLHPSLYLNYGRLNSSMRLEMVEGQIVGSQRIVKSTGNGLKIMPYFWYKYRDNHKFVDKGDLKNIFRYLSRESIDGLIIWGSSVDVNTDEKCKKLYEYVDGTLGPMLLTYFN